jgi:hypothetical protein
MKIGTWFVAVVIASTACSVAYAGAAAVPEIDAASSVGAIALLLGAVALVAERRRKRSSAE